MIIGSPNTVFDIILKICNITLQWHVSTMIDFSTVGPNIILDISIYITADNFLSIIGAYYHWSS